MPRMTNELFVERNRRGREGNQEFYLEESYPMDLIFPYLTPHGLIFQLNHQPLPALTPQMLEADHSFWEKEFRYVDFLIMQGRTEDAIRLVSTIQKLDPENAQYNGMLSQLQTYQSRQGNKAKQ